MAESRLDVAIIGAGLSGLALALALHQQSIPCTLYEARESPLNVGGGLMLAPNGLKVLDKLGIFEPLKKKGYAFDRIYIQDGNSRQILETIEYGGMESYGIRGLRTHRFNVIEELLNAVREKSIPVLFNKRFDHIISETEDSVTWQFRDGSNAKASLLVGADGIHSAVRSYLAPDVKPVFGSMASIVAAIPTTQLELPDGTDHMNSPSNTYPLPSGIMIPRLGAFVIAPQTYTGDEVMITVQRPVSEIAGARWADLDKDYLRSLFRQDSEHFPPIVQNAVRSIPDRQLHIWPFYQVPRLDFWTSAQTPGRFGRVTIVGDSAHALPPSAGQGVNQAFEDVYLFALILGRLLAITKYPSNTQLERALFEWQTFRQARVDRVIDLNKQMDLRRAPRTSSDVVDNESDRLDMGVMYEWLFNIDFKVAVDECLDPILKEA